ncbi:MAG: nucleotide exchange factor GrpE [Verrucomicrobia bacterium]|nr:nucleotide exchange factor GrpE [Verrucomicrobiota bacterium]
MSQTEPAHVNPTPSTPETEPAAATTPPPVEPGVSSVTAAEYEALLATAKKEAADNYDRYLRSVADLENYRKRAVRDREDAAHRSATRILEDLIPVLDNLSLGLQAAKAPNADLKTLVGGVEMVGQQLKSALAGHGLAEVSPLGQPFDPNLHEAISQQPHPEIAADRVCGVVRIGYTLNSRLVRAASVIVSTGAPEKPADPSVGVVV